MDTIVTFKVPTMSGQMPNLGISETGCQTEPASSYPGHSCENHIFASVTSWPTTPL